MYYDVLGISEYKGFDPIDLVHLQELEISGEGVGKFMTKDNEFPYDWNYGQTVYITFLSAIFGGTIILEGKKTHRWCFRATNYWFLAYFPFSQNYISTCSRCNNFHNGASHAFRAELAFSQCRFVGNSDWYHRSGAFGFHDHSNGVVGFTYLY